MGSGRVPVLIASEAVPTLNPAETARLTEFARACKAAARAVVLYPDGHPAVAGTLARIVQLTSAETLAAPLRLDVAPGALRLEGRAPARPDAALAELASLLHAHLIARLTVHPGGDGDAWKLFLRLLGRPPEDVRAEGGIARVWAATSLGHVELTQIDYGEVLREKPGGLAAAWDDIVASCLQGHAPALDDQVIRTLLAAARSSEELGAVLSSIEQRVASEGGGIGAQSAAIAMLLETLVAAVRGHAPEAFDSSMREVSDAVTRLSPETVLALLSSSARGGDPEASTLAAAIVEHMSDRVIAGFVARHALSKTTPTDRLALAFQALVREAEDQDRLIALAHDEAASSPLGKVEGFEQAWDEVARQLLTSYSDEPFVSEDYARELSGTRTRAMTVEQAAGDPADRIAAWLGTVATNELRRLDVILVLDLLRLEPAPERRLSLVATVVSLVADLLLLGDFESADVLLAASGNGAAPDAVAGAVRSGLVARPIVSHIVAHLPSIDDGQFERVKALCIRVGEGLIGALAEALAAEERTRPRERLTAIFMAFGAVGRREVERLKSSPNPSVRRAAVSLLREFGGKEALPELTELLGDSESQVQREAVRAILNIGTERAYGVLAQALTQGSDRSRDAIMQSLGMAREERTGPLFAYMLSHADHRGPLRGIYLKSIEALGALRDPSGIPALKNVLHRGEWWAPSRTAALRIAAAEALARIGTAEADEVLDDAARSGSRGVRSAVKRARGRA